MEFPLFNRARATIPQFHLTLVQLLWVLTSDPVLRDRTELVRTSDNPSRHKLNLGGVSLSGPFRGLPASDDHGQAKAPHSPYSCNTSMGYRNTAHSDWGRRTGIVLIDLDDLRYPACPGSVKVLLRHAAGAVATAWTSARGRGLKVGILVDPIPTSPDQNRCAWLSARNYTVDVLEAAGMVEGQHYGLDVTASVPQLAILAHNDSPLVRTSDPTDAVKWDPADAAVSQEIVWKLTGDTGSVVPSSNAWELVSQMSWERGNRSTSMLRLGTASAMSGNPVDQSRPVAESVANVTGMVQDYGLYASLRHFDRATGGQANCCWTVSAGYQHQRSSGVVTEA